MIVDVRIIRKIAKETITDLCQIQRKNMSKKVHDKAGVKIHVRRSENNGLCTPLKSVLSFHKAHNFPKLILCKQ